MLKYLHSMIAIPLIYLYTMAMATLSLLFSLHDPTGERQHWCARAWCRMISRTVGMKVTIHGLENLDLSRPAVYMSNHQSYMDTPTLFANLPFQFRIFAKKVLFYVPFMGWHLWRAGNIPVDRGNHMAAAKTLGLGADKVRSGVPVVIFPEGTRGTEAKLKKFKGGAFKMAQMAEAPIVPITIIGTARILPPNSLLFHPGPVEMHIGKPIETVENGVERDIPELIGEVERFMRAHLDKSLKENARHDQSDSVPVSLLGK